MRIELTLLSEHRPERCASTNSATTRVKIIAAPVALGSYVVEALYTDQPYLCQKRHCLTAELHSCGERT